LIERLPFATASSSFDLIYANKAPGASNWRLIFFSAFLCQLHLPLLLLRSLVFLNIRPLYRLLVTWCGKKDEKDRMIAIIPNLKRGCRHSLWRQGFDP